MDQTFNWKQFVQKFFEFPYYYQRENHFNFIDEKELLLIDSNIFSISKHIQSLKALKEKIEIEQNKKNNLKQKSKIPPKPQKPEEPGPDDCCGSGCRVCVFDLYYQKLEEYEEKLMEWLEKYESQSEDEDEANNK